jgi:peroxiredoxin Q/BCP
LNRPRPRVNLARSRHPIGSRHSAEEIGSNEGEMVNNLDIGDAAPDFELPADDGESASLRRLRGKTIVLYFYPKDDTSGCTAEAIAFNALRAKFDAAGAVVLGVSPDSAASHAKFKRKHDLKLTLAADERRATLEAYDVWRQKSLYGRRYMGVERATFLIDATGRIARVWRKVKVPGHAEEVLAAVEALRAPFAND